MDSADLSRRHFLIRSAAGVGAAWLTANWPAILEASQHAQHAAQAAAPLKFEFFTPEQSAEVEAIAAQIIPTDDSPGAREARVIYFIDRALTTFDKDAQKEYTEGLPQLQAKLKELFPAATKFSAATSEQQIAVLTAIEKTPFFGAVRGHAVMGFLADPARGGNFEQLGWKHINFTNDHMYKPPFGYYDRDYPGWEAANKPAGSGE
jgi:gluconate 2-dehydrogenase gamma chain